jgi:hypothetical protein
MQQGVKSVLVRFKHPAQRTPPDFQKCPVASRPPHAPPSLQLRRPSRDARVLGWLVRGGPDCTERRPKDWHKQMQPGRTWGRAELTWKSLQAPGHTSCRLEERADERAEDGQRNEGRKAGADSRFPICTPYSARVPSCIHRVGSPSTSNSKPPPRIPAQFVHPGSFVWGRALRRVLVLVSFRG